MTNPAPVGAAKVKARSPGDDRPQWSVARDIRWGAIDKPRAASQPEVLAALREIALSASSRPILLSAIIGAVWNDAYASALVAADLHAALKHFHAIRSYLDVVEYDPPIHDADVVTARRAIADIRVTTADVLPRLVELAFAHHSAAYAYRRLAEHAEEAVLAELLALLATDEVRLARCAQDVLAVRIAADATAKRDVLTAAVRFTHFGAAPTESAFIACGEPMAVEAFARRIEQLCGTKLGDYLRPAL